MGNQTDYVKLKRLCDLKYQQRVWILGPSDLYACVRCLAAAYRCSFVLTQRTVANTIHDALRCPYVRSVMNSPYNVLYFKTLPGVTMGTVESVQRDCVKVGCGSTRRFAVEYFDNTYSIWQAVFDIHSGGFGWTPCTVSQRHHAEHDTAVVTCHSTLCCDKQQQQFNQICDHLMPYFRYLLIP